MEKDPKTEKIKFSPEDIEAAQRGIEIMAERLDALLAKKDETGLTDKEQKEVDLIFNNIQPLVEITKGEVPWEFEKKSPEEYLGS